MFLIQGSLHKQFNQKASDFRKNGKRTCCANFVWSTNELKDNSGKPVTQIFFVKETVKEKGVLAADEENY